MKKVLLVGAVALLGLASCKKDYTCECTATVDFMGVKSSSSASTTIHDTKSNATTTCEKGNQTSTGSSVKCVIK